ncbi:MAG: hypothetical protein NC923_08015, partial [Candidatus Omnitrophica bacterium]|nr:hypothetical protein [Candidatus Omnitrophota bacterium]
EAYSEEERRMIGMCGNDSSQKILQHHTAASQQNKKRLCRMGQMYGKIYPNGDLLRCCVYEKLTRIDNIYENHDFNLLKEPTPCDIVPCPCWRAMLVGKESEWGHYWYSLQKK